MSSNKDVDQNNQGRQRMTLSLEGFTRELLEAEASRLDVSVQELVTFSVLYYLADANSGRVAREIKAWRPPSA
jgi:hypothetical protein